MYIVVLLASTVVGVFGDKEGLAKRVVIHSCKRPESAETRQSGWVDVRKSYVLKHVGFVEQYHKEKRLTHELGQYPHFVSLLGYDDRCQVLNISKAKFTRDPVCMSPNIERQVRYIFAVLEMLRIEPSVEFYYGWENNIFIDSKMSITMFDFGNYYYNGQPYVIRMIRDKLLHALYTLHQEKCLRKTPV